MAIQKDSTGLLSMLSTKDIAIFLSLTGVSAYVGSQIAKQKKEGATIAGVAFFAGVSSAIIYAYLNIKRKEHS